MQKKNSKRVIVNRPKKKWNIRVAVRNLRKIELKEIKCMKK